MVCIKQVSIPAVVLLSLAEQAVAAPVALRGDIVARDAAQTADAIELAIRELELDERGLGKVFSKVAGVIKKNPGKAFDRTLSTANTAMTVANTNKALKGKRDLELDERDLGELELALRDLQELDERDLDELELALRDLEDRSLKGFLTPIVKATKAITGNRGKTFDRLLSTANTGMAIANTHKTQKGKRDLEELDQRDIEEEIVLALRDLDLDLDERSILNIAKKVGGGIVKGVKAVGNVIKKNPGKTFDRTLSSANTAMTVANTNKALKGKRDLEDIKERDWEDIEERDVEELDERDFEDVEERDVEELDERDWEDVEERDVDDLEARAIAQSLGKLAKGVVKGVGHVIDSVSKQQGQAYNRANAAANSAMKVAQTKKKQEKRDFEERDFEYINSLSKRDLEDLELVVRALYGDYLEDY